MAIWSWVLAFSSLANGEVIEGKNGLVWHPVTFWIVGVGALVVSLRLAYKVWTSEASPSGATDRRLTAVSAAVFFALGTGQLVGGYAQSLAVELEDKQ